MNKEELINKIKEISIKTFSVIKQKAQEVFANLKAKYQAAKAKKANSAKPMNIYEDKNRELKPATATFSLKPMSLSGQKVSIKRSLLSSLKGFSSPFKNRHISGFTAAVLFLGSSVLSAWLLGLSFNTEAKPYCAFIAFFLIGFAIKNIKTAKGSSFYGLITGLLSNIFICGWIYDTVFGGTANSTMSLWALIGLSLVLTIPYILFAFFAWQYKHKIILYPFASACAWVALEVLFQLISYKWMGFPWFVLGYTQYANLELIQISSVLGVYGISFFIVFCSFSASVVLGKDIKFKDRFTGFLFIVIAAFLFLGYGKKQLEAASQPKEENKIIKVAIVQPNTHKDMFEGNIQVVQQKLNNIAYALQNYPDLDLVVWPESTLPDYLEEGSLKDFMTQLSANVKTYQIAGGSSLVKADTKQDKETEDSVQEFVAAGLYHQGKLIDKHYKRKLVPFGEYLPLNKYLKDVYEKNEISSLTGTYVRGSGPAKVFVLQGERESSFGPQICFESIFPILWRLQVLSGAEFFVNLSNDGWFLKTAAPYQHLRLNVFRAVENNRPILRSTNNGISAYINNIGKIEYHSTLDEQDIKFIDLVLPLNQNKTFYSRYGDIFGFLCLFLTLIFSYSCLDITKEND